MDLENAVVHVRQSVWRGQIQTVKSRNGNRRFPISAELAEGLRVYLNTWRPNSLGLLFATKTGTPWDHSLVRQRKFHPLLKRLAIPQCGFHAFRHGNATLRDQIGAPWRSGSTVCGTPRHKPPWATHAQSRPMNAGRQKNLGKFCTLLHKMNKTKGQRNIR